MRARYSPLLGAVATPHCLPARPYCLPKFRICSNRASSMPRLLAHPDEETTGHAHAKKTSSCSDAKLGPPGGRVMDHTRTFCALRRKLPPGTAPSCVVSSLRGSTERTPTRHSWLEWPPRHSPSLRRVRIPGSFLPASKSYCHPNHVCRGACSDI